MSLTTQGKDYIAQKFGINNCMVYEGLTWNSVSTSGQSQQESGGTALIVFRLTEAAVDRIELISPSTGTHRSADLTTNNLNQVVEAADASWISNNDGYPAGETQYCVGAGPTPGPSPSPTLQPTQLPPGMAGAFTFLQAPSGTPSVILSTNDIEMSQSSTDYHFEIDNLFITNNSANKAYIAVRVKLFTGAQSSCPTSGEVFDGMDRVSTSRNVRIKTLDPGEMEEINADFYQPAHIIGTHTVCLIIHGSFSKPSLEAEVAGITG